MNLPFTGLRNNYYMFTFILSLLIVGFSSLFFFEVGVTPQVFVINSIAWFLLVFLLPLWAGVFLIKKLRRHEKSHLILEASVLWIMLLSGAMTKLLFDSYYFDAKSQEQIFNMVTISIWWTVFFYGIERFFVISKKLVDTKWRATVAKIEARRYQLNPHMLFNSINAISSLIHTAPDKADKMLHDLADLLRYTLSVSQRARVPLFQELKILKKYIDIEKIRFADRLEFTLHADQDCTNIRVPPLIMQPLVENSIKHNSSRASLHIFVSCFVKDDRVNMVVSDNGVGFSVASTKDNIGIGLRNIKAQVSKLRDGKVVFSDQSEVLGSGASVTLSFSIKQS